MADVPLIDYALSGLREYGIDTVIMAVNYLADIIVDYLGHACISWLNNKRQETGGEADYLSEETRVLDHFN